MIINNQAYLQYIYKIHYNNIYANTIDIEPTVPSTKWQVHWPMFVEQ